MQLYIAAFTLLTHLFTVNYDFNIKYLKIHINHQLYKIVLFFHRNSQIRLSTFAHDIQLNKLDLNVK